jgi:hypothetical protein
MTCTEHAAHYIQLHQMLIIQDIEDIAEKFQENASVEDFDLDSDTEVKPLAPIMLAQFVADDRKGSEDGKREITPPAKEPVSSEQPSRSEQGEEEEEEVLTQRQTEDNDDDHISNESTKV